jgi:hypothetical protein
MQLTVNEANLIADICNPGFAIYAKWHGHENDKVGALVANVADAFRLDPGMYGEKWSVDESALLGKLEAAEQSEVVQLCDAITRFWEHCDEGKMMDAYYPVTA